MNFKKFLIILGGLSVLTILIALGYINSLNENVALEKVMTEKSEYKPGDLLKIKVENPLSKEICFSSCYPYYFEKNIGSENTAKWQKYSYVECKKQNLAENCIDPKSQKSFEIEVPALSLMDKGLHRIGLSACIGCSKENGFQENSRLYSNYFTIN